MQNNVNKDRRIVNRFVALVASQDAPRQYTQKSDRLQVPKVYRDSYEYSQDDHHLKKPLQSYCLIHLMLPVATTQKLKFPLLLRLPLLRLTNENEEEAGLCVNQSTRVHTFISIVFQRSAPIGQNIKEHPPSQIHCRVYNYPYFCFGSLATHFTPLYNTCLTYSNPLHRTEKPPPSSIISMNYPSFPTTHS